MRDHIPGEDLSQQLANAIQFLQAEIKPYEREEPDEEDHAIPADPTVKNFSYTIADGQVYYRENSLMHPVEVSVTAENRIRGMIELRECTRRLIEYQTEGYPDEDIAAEQQKLNVLYDSFTAKYGLMNSRGNKLAFSEDSSYCLLCSLEVLDEQGNLKRKADMFTRRTIRPHVAVTSVDTASEALAVSISEKARVDMDYMAELSGKSPEELEQELAGVIYRDIRCAENPEDILPSLADLSHYPLVTADEYLSGKVRHKLRMAKAFLKVAPDHQKETARRNVEALEAVQPPDLGAGEIGVRFDAGVGVSAGSANIASYLAGQKGRNYQFYAEYSSRKEYMSVAQRYGKAGRVDSMLSLHLFPLYLRQPQQVLHVGEDHLRLLLALVLQPLLDKGEKACPEEGEVIGNGLLLYGEPQQQGPHIPLQKLAESPVHAVLGRALAEVDPVEIPVVPDVLQNGQQVPRGEGVLPAVVVVAETPYQVRADFLFQLLHQIPNAVVVAVKGGAVHPGLLAEPAHRHI